MTMSGFTPLSRRVDAACAASAQINSALSMPLSLAFSFAFSIACGMISTPIKLLTSFAMVSPIVPVPQ